MIEAQRMAEQRRLLTEAQQHAARRGTRALGRLIHFLSRLLRETRTEASGSEQTQLAPLADMSPQA